MLSSLTASQRASYMHSYMSSLLTAAALNSGIFSSISTASGSGKGEAEEGKGWELVAVMMPPGRRVDNPMTWFQSGLVGLLWKLGYGGFKKMVIEYTGKSDAVKAKALPSNERYYYLFFIGTREDCRGKGLCGDMIRHYQSIAAKEGLPIWLEATTPYSMRQYERLGFKAVERFRLGVGVVGGDGNIVEGGKGKGEGVPVAGMIWRPPKE
jgi:hypothetical protein